MLEQVIAALEAKKHQQAVSNERFVREQRILGDLAPRVWRTLRLAIQAECRKYPQYLTFEVHPETSAVVRGANRRVLEVEYLREACRVVFQCGEASGEVLIGLDGQNRAVLVDDDGKPYPSEAYLAGDLLSIVLR